MSGIGSSPVGFTADDSIEERSDAPENNWVHPVRTMNIYSTLSFLAIWPAVIAKALDANALTLHLPVLWFVVSVMYCFV